LLRNHAVLPATHTRTIPAFKDNILLFSLYLNTHVNCDSWTINEIIESDNKYC